MSNTSYQAPLIIFVIIFGLVGFYGAYMFGQSQGKKIGYDNGFSAGKTQGEDDTRLAMGFENNALRDENKQLVADYNTLLDQVQRYVNTSSYQRKTISCASNDIGNFTYTNCY